VRTTCYLREMARLRRLVAWLHMLDGSAEAIGRGAALGLFIAFTPTIGFQVLLAAALAPLVRANVPAAVAMVWVTNPATIGPAFALTYRVGCLVLGGPSTPQAHREIAVAMHEHDVVEPWRRLSDLFAMGETVVVPLVVGGIVVGGLLGMCAYFVTVRIVRAHRRHVELRA
jgi:uncharacterized protein (DUF2062 family)